MLKTKKNKRPPTDYKQSTVTDEKKLKLTSEDSENYLEKDEEEQDLESFLFGSSKDLLLQNDNDDDVQVSKESDDSDNEGDLLSFCMSTKPNNVDEDESEDEEILLTHTTKSQNKGKAVWDDPDDHEISVDIQKTKKLRKLRSSDKEKVVSGTVFQDKLKSQFEKVLPPPAWADVSDRDSPEEDNNEPESVLFKKATKLMSQGKHLGKGSIKIRRVKDLNQERPSKATITSLEFHPTAKLAFTASMNKKLNVFQVDGEENKKLQSIHLQQFPIYNAHFTPAGDKIIMTSRRKFYYSYDLIAGNVTKIPDIKGHEEKSLERFTVSPDGKLLAFIGGSGYVHLVSSNTHHWISSMKMNGKVLAATFTSDSSKLYTSGRDGEVYIWDVKSRRCLHRFTDEGSISTTSIAISNDGKYVACGSSSGVVNLYDDHCFTQNHPTPTKVLMNLTTGISGTVFNPTSEILAYYSPQVRNALKLVHFPSLTTFSNWPMTKQTLGNVSCVDFSPLSGYIGIGNENGKASLFRLNHFPDS